MPPLKNGTTYTFYTWNGANFRAKCLGHTAGAGTWVKVELQVDGRKAWICMSGIYMVEEGGI